MAGVHLVEAAEVINVGVKDRRLDDVVHRTASGAQYRRKIQERLLGLRFDPGSRLAGRKFIPGIPEQKTRLPATIAWLYGRKASGA